MKKNILFIFLILGITAFVNGQTDGWINYKSVEGNFSVLLPNQPEIKTEDRVGQPKDLKTGEPNGNKVKYVNNEILSITPQSFYFIGWADYEEGHKFDTKTELENNVSLFIAGFEAKLISQKPIKLGKHDGIEFVAEKSSSGYVKGRTFVIGRRTLLVTGITRDKEVPANIETIDKFLDSFKLNVKE